MGKYVMGIDIGTTGAKSMVVDLSGKIIGKAYREYPLICPHPGIVEIAADNMMEQVFDTVNDAIKDSGVPAEEISAISFSVQRASFFMIDENLEPINDTLYVWLDTRATPIMDELEKLLPPDRYHQLCGMPLSPYTAPPKVYHIRKYQPEIFAKTKYIATVDAYAMHRFGSDRFVSETSTAQILSFVDMKTFDWCDELLDSYDIPRSMMPELVKPGDVVGIIKKDISERTGLAVGTLIVAGSGDQQAGAMGSAVVEDGDMSLTLGTAGLLIVGLAKPDISKLGGLMVDSTPNLEVFEIEGNQCGGATCYRWARDVFCPVEVALANQMGVDAYDLMGNYIDKSGPGSNGVMFYAGLFGAGYPFWNGNAAGAFVGLKSNHKRDDMLRAVMEGVTFESRLMLEAIEKTGVFMKDELTISGGATKSPTWRQIIADIMNKRVKVLKVSDASIIGVAIIAAVAAGFYKDFAEGVLKMVQIADTVEPIPENVELYSKLFPIYKDVYYALDDRKIAEKLSAAMAK